MPAASVKNRLPTAYATVLCTLRHLHLAPLVRGSSVFVRGCAGVLIASQPFTAGHRSQRGTGFSGSGFSGSTQRAPSSTSHLLAPRMMRMM
ncbi:hypothetical protein NDU88_005003 [Pleurodeles waltl]|uniref:Uncharacterized protein n=1 Tax=Pleurodeles waltl TaxID=8319 RepID=A0AAV7LMZ7_PLEWA|nr:hypothetical protein NDU88_005003 [Pleurodeles waltl]